MELMKQEAKAMLILLYGISSDTSKVDRMSYIELKNFKNYLNKEYKRLAVKKQINNTINQLRKIK